MGGRSSRHRVVGPEALLAGGSLWVCWADMVANALPGRAAIIDRRQSSIEWWAAMGSAAWIGLSVGFYVSAAFMIGTSVRALVTSRARAEDVRRFRLVRRFGLFTLCRGVGLAIFGTAGLLHDGPRVTLILLGSVIVLALLLEVVRSRRGQRQHRVDNGRPE